MKHAFTVSVFFLFAVCIITGGIGAENQPKKRVMNYLAVMNLNCGKILAKEECSVLTDMVIEELVKSDKYTVIDRANRDKILSEVGFQMTGCVDESCTVEAGRILGVGKIVTGKLGKLGTTYIVNLQLINVETGALEIAVSEECECEIKGLINAVHNAARKLMGDKPRKISGNPTTTPATRNSLSCNGYHFAFAQHDYCAYTTPVTWMEAKNKCENDGGHLVTISSLEENNAVMNAISILHKQHCWIGLSEVERRGDWRWVTGEPITFTYWGFAQPDNYGGGLQCVSMGLYRKQHWHDGLCNQPDTGYVCESD